jgi:cell wall-associated NlpC family hydrolase
MNLRKIICAGVLAVVTLNSTAVFATQLNQQLKEQRNVLAENKEKLEEIEDKREDIEIAIQELDGEIEESMHLIESYKKKIAETEKQIKTTEEELKKAVAAVDEQQKLLDKRLRAIYKSGQDTYLSMLITADNISEFLSRAANIKRIVDYDKKIIADLEAKREEANKKKLALDSQKESIVAMEKDTEKKLALIKEKSSQQHALIEELKNQERIFAAKVTESQNQVNATLAQIKSIRSAAQKYVPSRGAAPISDNAIIAYASNFLGTPYVWGGTRPDPGFDCSGFTKYVYAHFGVSLGRTTKDQIHNGYAVSRDQLQPGDLVFFGKNGVPNHMGIYVGNNTYIHSPQTGDVVKISAMTRKDYIVGRRVK